jgi:ankyrin repeat protein
MELAQLFIEHGVDAAARDMWGSTPLHVVSRRGHLEFALFLVKHGADTTAQGQCGFTPLHEASKWGI